MKKSIGFDEDLSQSSDENVKSEVGGLNIAGSVDIAGCYRNTVFFYLLALLYIVVVFQTCLERLH